jgi:hypothetical protein
VVALIVVIVIFIVIIYVGLAIQKNNDYNGGNGGTDFTYHARTSTAPGGQFAVRRQAATRL